MNKNKPTCGPLFELAWKEAVSMTDDPVSLFSAGHMCGQAEKIYLGACKAAMFRPSTNQGYAFVLNFALYLSKIYGLNISTLDAIEECKNEIWLHSKDSNAIIEKLLTERVNSQLWHMIRGLLCGVPFDQIDPWFHLRRGYNQPCDKKEGEEI